MRPSLPSLALLAWVALPWARAVADDAPPAPPPAPKDAPDGAAPDRYRPHVIPGIRYVPHKVEEAWLVRWLHQPGPYKVRLTMPSFYRSTLDGQDLRAEPPPPAPLAPATPQATTLPRGIVAIGDLSDRIAAARAAGRETEAVELQAALDGLNREREGTDARSRVVWIGAGETLRGERLTVDEQELPPGKYAVVRSELGPRTLRATAASSSSASVGRVAIASESARFTSIDGNGNTTFRYVETPTPRTESTGGSGVPALRDPHPPLSAPGQPFTVTRNPDGTNTITFTAAPGPTRPGAGSGRPGLSTAIDELRTEIRALREEIRALRAALEGTPSPK